DGTFQLKTTVPFAIHYAGLLIPEAVTSVAVGDFRADGKQDIVALSDGTLSALLGHGNAPVTVLLGNGDGTFQTAVPLGVGPVSVDSLAVGDFTGDGKLDIATSNFPPPFTGAPGLSVLAGNGDGTFRAAQTVALGETANALAVGDFRGTGKVDLVLASRPNHV